MDGIARIVNACLILHLDLFSMPCGAKNALILVFS